MHWVDLTKVMSLRSCPSNYKNYSEQNFPIGLLQIGLNEECEVSVRQSCSVLLKNWIECHWSTASEKFKVCIYDFIYFRFQHLTFRTPKHPTILKPCYDKIFLTDYKSHHDQFDHFYLQPWQILPLGIGQKFGLNLFPIYYRLSILIISTLLTVHCELFVSFRLMLPTLMLLRCWHKYFQDFFTLW